MSDPLYIVDQAALIDFCHHLHGISWLALDTEFIREQTFYPQLCLIQIATPDQVACIDPLTLPSLDPLLERLYDPTITKVLHAAYQDLELFFHLRGAVPAPVFDTQIAALVLGNGSQIGYAALVAQEIGVTLTKAHSRANWRHRPLAPAWLAYAADDVRYLGMIYHRQIALLQARGWLDALEEDFQMLTDPKRYYLHPEEAWRRVRDQNRLRGVQLAALRVLAAWREDQASHQDRPRRWIVDDAALIELARRMPATLDELAAIRTLPPAVRQQHGSALLECIATARSEPPGCWPSLSRRRRLSPEQTTRIAEMMDFLEQRAMQYGIAPQAIAERRELESLLLGEDSRLNHGWKKRLIGQELQELAQR